MPVKANEKLFESRVEEILLTQAGWTQGNVDEWDQKHALFPDRLFSFLQATQPELWQSMRDLHGDNLEDMLVRALVKELNLKGTLHVLRHGFKFYGKTFQPAQFRPAHGLSPDVLKQYGRNELTVTRQVPCNASGGATADIVLALNGLPLATIELKNSQTNQTWRKAVQQYRERDPHTPLFAFKSRALVHFAADSEEVYMTTRLQKGKTYFLPFNRGSHPGSIECGAGNPAHSSGYRTGYFWEEVLQRDSFLDIIGHFMFIQKREEKVDDGHGSKKTVKRETLIFPRYHQLDAVRRLIATARAEGPGHNYLIQHSAGSGKTNSISWLSHRLASLHNDADEKVFDCVIVITDRTVLDDQLQDAIYQIEHVQGVVQGIDDNAAQLARALVDGTRIVVTTLQKFPFVLKGLLRHAGADDIDNPDEEARAAAREMEKEIANRRYAVIVDEAHSSQTGETAREMKELLGSSVPETGNGEEDWEDGLNRVLQSRLRQPNVSFFSFTATPKGKTLELFGREGQSGKPEAFHTYSMRQAIEEGFILDVLRNYTTYRTYFRLLKAIESDPQFPKKKGARALAKFVVLHPENVEQKIEIIVEHFRRSVRHHLDGRAKAMVVTSSRLHAVKYKLGFDAYIKEKGYDDVRALVAFSGKVTDPDTQAEYTEPGMNPDVVNGKPISEKQLPERFNSSDYQVLIVANKYQTGFDEPLLMAMYVDKRLDGVQAVQTLSRLNRKISGKEAPFVLDFINESDDIYKAFKPYYDATSLQEVSDPQKLEELKHQLDESQVYHASEVEEFARVFYKNSKRQKARDHSDLKYWAQPCVDRFKAIEDEDQRREFRDRLAAYVNLYAFLSQIMPYPDADLEKLYSFGWFVLPDLPTGNNSTAVRLEGEVELAKIRTHLTFSGAIDLADGETEGVKSPTDVGTGRVKEEETPLSELIRVLNEKFGAELDDEDRYFFEQIREKAAKSEEVIETAKANTLDKFALGIGKRMESLMIERMGDNDDLVTRYLEDEKFRAAALPFLAKAIYQSIVDTAG